MADQLHISILIIMNLEECGTKTNVKVKKELLDKDAITSVIKGLHLYFHDSYQLRCRLRDTELPF